MKFYFLHEGFYEGVQFRLDQIKLACEKLNVEFIAINSLMADYSKLPTLTKTDLLYNATRGSETLETLLLNKEVTTFYIHNPDFVVSNPDTTKYSIIHDKANLLSPKTIFNITADRQLLKKYVDYLGGFHSIIKAIGSTRGIGTIKIDSWQSLISTVDYLIKTTDKFIIRQFINANHGARVMVLGDEVVAYKKFLFQEDDFRNAPILSQTRYEAIEIDDALKNLCIESVHLANLEMAGVDLLFEKETGKAYLLEINFPTGFQSFMDNVPLITEKWIQYLIDKSKRNG
jgi:glutathione synthase/RimK-type ligase-like ATP-grasp enzyme